MIGDFIAEIQEKPRQIVMVMHLGPFFIPVFLLDRKKNIITLIRDHKLTPYLKSERRGRGYNTDNIFANEEIAAQCIKETGKLVPNTQHRHILYKKLCQP